MDQAALPERPWEADLDGADQPGRPVRDDEERIRQPAPLEVLEEGRAARGILLRPRGEVEEYLAPVLGNAPGAEDGLARQPGV